jgi:hypothetical protein
VSDKKQLTEPLSADKTMEPEKTINPDRCMSEFTPEEMLKVARRVYPKFVPMVTNRWGKDEVCLYWDDGGFHAEFKPKIDGDADERQQALDVILAVKRLYPRSVWSFDWQEYDGQKAVIYTIGHRDEEVGRGNDLLTAALRAILQGEG